MLSLFIIIFNLPFLLEGKDGDTSQTRTCAWTNVTNQFRGQDTSEPTEKTVTMIWNCASCVSAQNQTVTTCMNHADEYQHSMITTLGAEVVPVVLKYNDDTRDCNYGVLIHWQRTAEDKLLESMGRVTFFKCEVPIRYDDPVPLPMNAPPNPTVCQGAIVHMRFRAMGSAVIAEGQALSVVHDLEIIDPIVIEIVRNDTGGPCLGDDSITVTAQCVLSDAVLDNAIVRVNSGKGTAVFDALVFRSCTCPEGLTFSSTEVPGVIVTGPVTITPIPNTGMRFLTDAPRVPVIAGSLVRPAIRVGLEDSCGALDISNTGLVLTATGTGVVGGTATVTGGIAIFDRLGLNVAGVVSLTITADAHSSVAVAGTNLTTDVNVTEVVTTNPPTTEAPTTNPPPTTEAPTTNPPPTTEAPTTNPPMTNITQPLSSQPTPSQIPLPTNVPTPTSFSTPGVSGTPSPSRTPTPSMSPLPKTPRPSSTTRGPTTKPPTALPTNESITTYPPATIITSPVPPTTETSLNVSSSPSLLPNSISPTPSYTPVQTPAITPLTVPPSGIPSPTVIPSPTPSITGSPNYSVTPLVTPTPRTPKPTTPRPSVTTRVPTTKVPTTVPPTDPPTSEPTQEPTEEPTDEPTLPPSTDTVEPLTDIPTPPTEEPTEKPTTTESPMTTTFPPQTNKQTSTPPSANPTPAVTVKPTSPVSSAPSNTPKPTTITVLPSPSSSSSFSPKPSPSILPTPTTTLAPAVVVLISIAFNVSVNTCCQSEQLRSSASALGFKIIMDGSQKMIFEMVTTSSNTNESVDALHRAVEQSLLPNVHIDKYDVTYAAVPNPSPTTTPSAAPSSGGGGGGSSSIVGLAVGITVGVVILIVLVLLGFRESVRRAGRVSKRTHFQLFAPMMEIENSAALGGSSPTFGVDHRNMMSPTLSLTSPQPNRNNYNTTASEQSWYQSPPLPIPQQQPPKPATKIAHISDYEMQMKAYSLL